MPNKCPPAYDIIARTFSELASERSEKEPEKKAATPARCARKTFYNIRGETYKFCSTFSVNYNTRPHMCDKSRQLKHLVTTPDFNDTNYHYI